MANNEQQPKFTSAIFGGIGDSREPAPLSDFLDYLKANGDVYEMTLDAFLKFEGSGFESNLDSIVSAYTPKEQEKYKNEIQNGNPPYIKIGTSYSLPTNEITAEFQKILGSDLFSNEAKDFETYWQEKIVALIKDEEYVRDGEVRETKARAQEKRERTNAPEKTKVADFEEEKDIVYQAKALSIRVWWYSKIHNKIYDISPWIISCSTSKTFGTGNFQLSLTPTLSLTVPTSGEEFTTQFSVLDKRGYLNEDFFTKFMQANDVIFIRFEKLKKESFNKRERVGANDHVVPQSDLSNKLIWDMIGLVDNCTFSADGGANSVDYQINVSGRDFMKLLVEDGSYFIPLKFVEGSPDRWFYGGNPESSWFKRNMVTGAYDYYFSYAFQRIDNVAWFIINQLSNIGIVNDSVFSGCARQKEKLPIETGDSSYNGVDNTVHGVWQMIQVWIDKQLSDRRIVDRSLANPEGTLFDLFKKICQEPFVEFWGDTWNEGFDILIRKPPFTRSAITKALMGQQYITVKSKDVYSLSLTYDERAYGWYRLIPQNSLMGKGNFSSLALVPIIFLDEYVKSFGNRRCITNDMYLSEKSLSGKDFEKGLNTMSQALLNDLLFVVETTAYLPFTRKGTITINGDRRIKVGTFIFLELTGELFYVTGVDNSVSFGNDLIDRVTTLTVERGMMTEYIVGKAVGSTMSSNSTLGGKDVTYSYFTLVNLEGIRKEITKRESKKDIDDVQDVSTEFGVNKDVFDFFMKRKMYGWDD